MNPELIKAFDSLVPYDQAMIAGLIVAMATKDERISKWLKLLAKKCAANALAVEKTDQ